MNSLKKSVAAKSMTAGKSIIRALWGERNSKHLYALIRNDLDYNVQVGTRYGPIVFHCPDELLIWRAETLMTKEPETIEWIDRFDNNSVFWDIGANIGCYALYAGKKGVKTYAFEPQCANYFILNTNIQLNDLDDNVRAINIAFSDNNFLGSLNIPILELGGAMNCFGESMDEFSAEGHHYDVSYHQGVLGFTIDSFVSTYGLEPPNHIKIDVDGHEKEILLGAADTLRHDNMQSILVEMDENDIEYVNFVTDYLAECGLKLEMKEHSEMIEHSDFRSVYNYIFQKTS